MADQNSGDQARKSVQSPAVTPSGASSNLNQSANNGNRYDACNSVYVCDLGNPSAPLPPHVQEQLRRQIQAQQFLRLQQQQMMMNARPPTGMMPMSMPGGLMPPRMPPPQMPTGMVRPQSMSMPMSAPQMQPQSTTVQSCIPANRLEMLSRVTSYHAGMDENSFMMSLQQFLSCVNLPLKKAPVINGKPISLLQLFRTVAGYGGFTKVSDGRRWPAVAASIGLPPSHIDSLASLHSLYGTLLFPYEQYMLSKVPADKIQWPSAVTRAFSSTPPTPTATAPSVPTAQPPSSSRLTSVLQKTPSTGSVQGSTTSLGGPQLKATGSQVPLEAIGVQQWKNAHSVGNPLAALKRGRYTLAEIVLFLESGQKHLIRFALNLVQNVSIDSNFFPQDHRSFSKLIGLILDCCENGATDGSTSTWKMARKASRRPDCIEPDGHNEVSEIASNIIRSFSLRPECKVAVEKALTSRSSLLLSWACQSVSLELRKNSLLVLSEISPKIQFPPSSLNIFFDMLEADVAELNELLLQSTQRSFLVWPSNPSDAETMKKHIVGMIQNCSNFFKTIPPVAFIELQALYNILLHLVLADDNGGKKRLFLGSLQPVALQLVSLIDLLLQPILKITGLIHDLLQLDEFKKSPDYGKWFQKILHSTSFGLPDGGYCELVLLCVKTCAALFDKPALKAVLEQSRLINLLQNGSSSFRSMWECSEPGSPVKFERPIATAEASAGRKVATRAVSVTHTDKSPLLWQSCSSACSHPYQVYLLLVKMLDDLTVSIPDVMAGKLDVGRVLGWVCGEGIACRLSKEILETPELCELYGRLLECAMSAAMSPSS